MIRKEIRMHLIAYNCIRCLIQIAADKRKVAANKISFKGSIQALIALSSQGAKVMIGNVNVNE